MTRHFYQSRIFKKIDSFSDKVAVIWEIITKGSFMMACLTVPIRLLVSFSETMATICDHIIEAWLYVFAITIGIYGVCFILAVIVRIVVEVIWDCVWAISKLLDLVRKQIANSFKV